MRIPPFQMLFISGSLFTTVFGCGPSSQDYVGEGLVKLQTNDYIGAVEDFTRSIHKDDRNAVAYFERAKAKMMLGLHQEAIQDLDATIELTPTHDDAHAKKATALFNLERYSDAIASTRQALLLNPANQEALIDQGNAHFFLGNYEESIDADKQLIEIDSSQPRPYFNIGVSCERLKKYDEARVYYQAAKDHGYDGAKIDEHLAQLGALQKPAQTAEKNATNSADSYAHIRCIWCNSMVDIRTSYSKDGKSSNTRRGRYEIESELQLYYQLNDEYQKKGDEAAFMAWAIKSDRCWEGLAFCSLRCYHEHEQNN